MKATRKLLPLAAILLAAFPAPALSQDPPRVAQLRGADAS